MTANLNFHEKVVTEKPAGEVPAPSWEALASVAKYKPAELARAADVPLPSLRRHFSRRYRLNLADWLKDVRFKEAYQRLSAGDPIDEVSEDLGFKSGSTFEREFERHFGFAANLLEFADRQQNAKAL